MTSSRESLSLDRLHPRLRKITVPVLVMQGDDDQIVPYPASGPPSARRTSRP